MLLNKPKAYSLLQALLIVIIFSFQFFWIFSKTTEATILEFDRAADYGSLEHVETMRVGYYIGYDYYESVYTRNETPDLQRKITIRYSLILPSISRVDDFWGNWFTPILIYMILFTATTMLFTIPNDILPKRTVFEFKRKYPYIRSYKN